MTCGTKEKKTRARVFVSWINKAAGGNVWRAEWADVCQFMPRLITNGQLILSARGRRQKWTWRSAKAQLPAQWGVINLFLFWKFAQVLLVVPLNRIVKCYNCFETKIFKNRTWSKCGNRVTPCEKWKPVKKYIKWMNIYIYWGGVHNPTEYIKKQNKNHDEQIEKNTKWQVKPAPTDSRWLLPHKRAHLYWRTCFGDQK